MRDEAFTDEQVALAHRLYQAGLRREWQPGDRLVGGELPVRVVWDVSVEGDPLVEVERGGKVEAVRVAHPRIWLPGSSTVLDLLNERGFEGALVFKRGRYGLRYRRLDDGADYRLVAGNEPRTVCYRVLLTVLEADGAPPEEAEPAELQHHAKR
ncbi:MAG: hypothetical protein HYU66_03100 [Armatimonadetes bacterium]|nr:hypothetical protein [Armatimonadota bacterium]